MKKKSAKKLVVVADRRKKVERRKNPLVAAALLTNQRIRLTGELPKPRLEVRKSPNGFASRLIDKYGRKGEWGARFTLRNNCRRQARKAHPGIPVVSQ